MNLFQKFLHFLSKKENKQNKSQITLKEQVETEPQKIELIEQIPMENTYEIKRNSINNVQPEA